MIPHRLPASNIPHDVQEVRESILADVDTLVSTESSSYDLDALAECRETLENLMRQRLGDPDSRSIHPGGEHGDLLEMTYSGNLPDRVLLVGHYDTVWPTGTCETWPLHHVQVPGRDECLSGPGAVDMKSGIVVAMWSLVLARSAGAALPTVTFLFNADEEIGSPSSRAVIEQTALGHDASLVFEGCVDGAVKTHRKGVGIFTLTCTGVESHAGNFPEQGASAITAMAELIPQLNALADPDAGTTINVGRIEGGTGSNVVAGRCTVKVDVRVAAEAEQARIDRGLAQLRPNDSRVDLDITNGWNRPPMTMTDASLPLFEQLQDAANRLGYRLGGASVGGGSDANFISASGGAVVCGLGPDGGGPHARHEFVEVSLILEQTALVRQFLINRA